MAHTKEHIINILEQAIRSEQEITQKRIGKIFESEKEKLSTLMEDIASVHECSENLSAIGLSPEHSQDRNIEESVKMIRSFSETVSRYRSHPNPKSLHDAMEKERRREAAVVKRIRSAIEMVSSDDGKTISINAMEKLGLLPLIRSYI